MILVHHGLGSVRPFLKHEADRMQQLADDLRAIADGGLPTPAILEAAPVAHDWRIGPRTVPMLVGHTVGHPNLPTGPVYTTEVIAADLTVGWARTLSRFYVLGERASGGSSDV